VRCSELWPLGADLGRHVRLRRMKGVRDSMSGGEAAPSILATIELAIAGALADAADADETYHRVLAEIGTAMDWELGAVWEVSPVDDLHCVALWQASPEDTSEFRTLTEHITFERGEGLPGRVWDSGEPAWIVDVVEDANFPRADAAARAGLHAAFCFPIRSPSGIVGTMEFFARTLEEPNEELLASMAVLGSFIGQFVERRRAEDAVRGREALTGAMLCSALDAVITIDERGRIMEFNPAAERIFGYARDETIGKDMADLVVPPSLRAPHRNGLARYLETGQSVYLDGRVELTGMRSGGSEFPVELAITQIDLPGPPTFMGFIRDITERKSAEAELRASRVRIVETAAAERRRLERNLHDGAQQYLNALALKLRVAIASVGEDPNVTRELLEDARSDLATAVEELRELARGIHPAILTDYGLGRALIGLAERSPIDVSLTEVPTERLSETLEVAAYYVVAEGLTNIAKYAEADRATVSVVLRGGLMVVEVVDEGRGGADLTKGTGLRGLADRVEALGGRLVVTSPLGVGTRLHAEIPTASSGSCS
jgi:PAS domain S-box-containing protein